MLKRRYYKNYKNMKTASSMPKIAAWISKNANANNLIFTVNLFGDLFRNFLESTIRVSFFLIKVLGYTKPRVFILEILISYNVFFKMILLSSLSVTNLLFLNVMLQISYEKIQQQIMCVWDLCCLFCIQDSISPFMSS